MVVELVQDIVTYPTNLQPVIFCMLAIFFHVMVTFLRPISINQSFPTTNMLPKIANFWLQELILAL